MILKDLGFHLYSHVMGPNFDVLICEDHPICQMGIEAAISHGTSKKINLRKAVAGSEALDLAKEKKPDLVIIDLTLPDMTGIELIKELRRLFEDIRILVITNSSNPFVLKQVIQLNVNGVVQKTLSLQHLSRVLSMFVEKKLSDCYIDPTVARICQEVTDMSLTRRETEVLELIAQGKTSREIGRILRCALETVKTHRSHVMNKCGARNTAELVAWYLLGNGKGHSGS